MSAEQLACAVEAIRVLHKPNDLYGGWCVECQADWPCPTIRAVDEALQ